VAAKRGFEMRFQLRAGVPFSADDEMAIDKVKTRG
jgi:hypothetical protein